MIQFDNYRFVITDVSGKQKTGGLQIRLHAFWKRNTECRTGSARISRHTGLPSLDTQEYCQLTHIGVLSVAHRFTLIRVEIFTTSSRSTRSSLHFKLTGVFATLSSVSLHSEAEMFHFFLPIPSTRTSIFLANLFRLNHQDGMLRLTAISPCPTWAQCSCHTSRRETSVHRVPHDMAEHKRRKSRPFRQHPSVVSTCACTCCNR